MTSIVSHESTLAELKRVFGYDSFRPNQSSIVSSILSKQDVLAVLPTGSGKSICYQLPGIIMEGTAIVISPLISLMQDQVDDLKKSGVKAAYVNSSLDWRDAEFVLSHINDYDLLYIAPERLGVEGFTDRLKQANISFFVIDEAHCISQWGHSFRPDYRLLSVLKEILPGTPVTAFTATATRDVAKDIATQLRLNNPHTIIAGFDRPNLMLRIYERSNLETQVMTVLKSHPGDAGIIYAGTRKQVDSMTSKLQGKGISVAAYHAGLSDNDRQKAHQAFMLGHVDVVVATVAFGMGIHKPDVRFVCHLDMPKSMEQYYQEIGRAGRDGLPSECIMFYGIQDLMFQKRLSDDIPDDRVRVVIKRKTEQLFSFCTSTECRRISILRYFGENYAESGCGGCDNCCDEIITVDGTELAQKILSCVYRLRQRFGLQYVVDVLAGGKTKIIQQRGHETLSTFGLLSDMPKVDIRYYIFLLLNMGYLHVTEGDYPCLTLTKRARDILYAGKTVQFRKRELKVKKETLKTRVKRTSIKGSNSNDPALTDYDDALFASLKALRLTIAQSMGVPAFMVFGDKVLMQMAYHKPTSKAAMLNINGVGERKLDQFGDDFISAISNYLSA